jgi:hypothetical protein
MCGGRLLILNKLGDGADHPSLHEAYPYCTSTGEWEYKDWYDEECSDVWHPYYEDALEKELESWLRAGRYTRSLASIFEQYPFVNLLSEDDEPEVHWGYCLFTLVGAWNPEELEYIRSMLSKIQRNRHNQVFEVTELRKEHDWLISARGRLGHHGRGWTGDEGDIAEVVDTSGNYGWDWDMLLDPAINRAVAKTEWSARNSEGTRIKALWTDQGDLRVMYSCGFVKTSHDRPPSALGRSLTSYIGMPAGRTKDSAPWHDAIARQVLELAEYNETGHVYMTDNCLTTSLEYHTAEGVPSSTTIMTGTKSLVVYLLRNWRWVKQALATHDPAHTWSCKRWPLASNPNERNHDIMGMSLFRTPIEEES